MNLIVISLHGTLFTHCQVDERRRKQPKKQTISQPTNQPTKETNKQTNQKLAINSYREVSNL